MLLSPLHVLNESSGVGWASTSGSKRAISSFLIFPNFL